MKLRALDDARANGVGRPCGPIVPGSSRVGPVTYVDVQGSCRMGVDPTRSVVDRNGELHDVKRLVVGGGSLVSRTLPVTGAA